MSRMKDPGELRTIYATPKERALGKVIGHLDRHCARFVELSPFCILGSTDVKGRPDLSPRGGGPGFVKVLDTKTLLLPDRRGNNRLDNLSNLISNPSVALLFLVPGIDETLRVYGAAEVLADSEICKELTVNGHEPKVILKIKVEQAYFQCAKSLMRARLWNADAKVERSSFPPLGEILKEQMRSDAAVESQEQMLQRYLKDL
jgi:PPOX class probable FMN-dependent enzyme